MVFSGRKFIVISNHTDNPSRHDALVNLIKANGGEIVAWGERADGDVSPKLIIVASSSDYDRAEEMRRFMIPTVTENWIHACIREKKLVPMKPYSPDPRNFMKEVIACFSDLSSGDSDVFKAGILASGGECSDIVTRYTSHVVANGLDTAECQLVLQSRRNSPDLGIKLVRPEWIDACMSLKVKVDDTPYLLTNESSEIIMTQNMDLTGTFPIKDSPRLAVQQSMREGLGSNILDSRKFYLGNDLDLSERVSKTVNYLIELNGGEIARDLQDAQVYVGKWREGEQYIRASKQKLIVGNVTWLYWVMIHQKFEKPNHLLHYPEVRGGLPSMRDFKICVTNYTGDARAYLQSLIVSLGATYSGKLIENNSTHLITAYESGQKYEAAKRWGIPVVNHLWLEDCYAYWQAQDPTSRLYTYFSPKLSMSTLIGTRNLVANVLNKFQRPEELTIAREQHAKRQAKQRAGNWLHDAMVIENEFHQKLKKGKLFPEDEDEDEDEVKDEEKNKDEEAKEKEVAGGVFQDEPGRDHGKDQPPNHRKMAQPALDATKSPNGNKRNSGEAARSSVHSAQDQAPRGKKPKVSSAVDKSVVKSHSPEAPSTSSQDHIRVMFSGVDDPPSNKACARLGLSVVKTLPVQVIVAPRPLKTVKFLQGLATASEFVRPSWIDASLRSGNLLPVDSYRIEDEHLSSALEARDQLHGKGLLEDIKLQLDPELKDKGSTFRDIVKAHGGAVVTRSSPNAKIVGEGEGQMPFAKFIESVLTMDRTAF